MADKVPIVPAMSREKIERRAVALLTEAQPGVFHGELPVDIEQIYEIYIPDMYHIEVGYTDLNPLGPHVLGYTDAINRRSFVDKTLVDTHDSVTLRRGRATIGHESAHCICHVNVLNYFQSALSDEGLQLYRAKRGTIKAYMDPEWQAWEFARACLMPRNLVTEYFNGDCSLQEMADLFDVNPAFLKVRLKTLGLGVL